MDTKSTQFSLPIAKRPWTKLGKSIESCIRKALYDYDMLDFSQDTLGIALSGGKDSLTLLFQLKEILGRGFPYKKIHAFHVSGTYSCGASLSNNYLKRVCQELEIPLTILETKQSTDNLNCYSCSRTRRSLLFNAAKKHNISHIAFGHHQDDSIQTLLMNLLHKAEFCANLAKVPMVDYGITILRPLIYISEADILEFAKLYKFQRITCQCPVGQNSLRKQTNDLLQEIEKTFPNARINLAKASILYGSNKALTP